jgi:hypothetical protein
MTATQMKFGGGYNEGRESSEESRGGLKNKLKNKNNLFNEESKGSSLPRGIGGKKKTGGKAGKSGKGSKKKGTIDITNKANGRNSNGSQEDYEDYESRNHSESDEAVDDRGAAFQNRNGPEAYDGY